MKQKKHNQKKPLKITNAYKKLKPYKTQRTKQQTSTPNTIYTTLDNSRESMKNNVGHIDSLVKIENNLRKLS